jgi:hypothetical protein
MSAREDIQERRRALKEAYRGIYAEVADILFRHDPIGIAFADNTDEYEPEVDTILPRLADARDAADARKVLHEELVRWFSPEDAGPEERHFALADEVWAAYTRFRARGGALGPPPE